MLNYKGHSRTGEGSRTWGLKKTPWRSIGCRKTSFTAMLAIGATVAENPISTSRDDRIERVRVGERASFPQDLAACLCGCRSSLVVIAEDLTSLPEVREPGGAVASTSRLAYDPIMGSHSRLQVTRGRPEITGITVRRNQLLCSSVRVVKRRE